MESSYTPRKFEPRDSAMVRTGAFWTFLFSAISLVIAAFFGLAGTYGIYATSGESESVVGDVLATIILLSLMSVFLLLSASLISSVRNRKDITFFC